MASEHRYGVLRSLSTFLGFAGWVQVFLGALVFIVGVLSGGVGIFSGLVGGIAVAISGLILVAIAQALDVFIDIALNTAPIAQLVGQNAAMVAFFDNFKNRNSSVKAPVATSGIDQAPVDQGSFEGVPWRSYADGRVVAVINQKEKAFSSGAEFTAFVYSRK